MCVCVYINVSLFLGIFAKTLEKFPFRNTFIEVANVFQPKEQVLTVQTLLTPSQTHTHTRREFRHTVTLIGEGSDRTAPPPLPPARRVSQFITIDICSDVT